MFKLVGKAKNVILCAKNYPYLDQCYLSNMKSLFAANSRAGHYIFSTKKIIIFLKLLTGHFYGQFFIKTVLGAFHRPVVLDKMKMLSHNRLRVLDEGCWTKTNHKSSLLCSVELK